ncbi:MAG: hypothetical protein KGS45_01640 [Planctomycetes bacterium]|nr:hypothetical protein [Planctomycetota bacterium]
MPLPVTPANDAIILRPHPSTWSTLAQGNFARAAADADIRAFRAELSIATDRPVLISGHQAMLWHPGILAKWLAMNVAADSIGTCETIWLSVDQDDNDGASLRAPVRREGTLRGLDIKLDSPLAAPGTPTGCRPTARSGPLTAAIRDDDITPPSVRAHIPYLAQALDYFSSTSSLAEQMTLTTAKFLRWFELERSTPAELLFSSDLSKTTAFKGILSRMISDPASCVATYNQAVLHAADADLRPLTVSSTRNRFELPLWLLRTGEPRRKIYSDELASLSESDRARLAPRALLMTGLIRAFGCDLFIHGTGGEKYDLATERWFASWLGLTLAPKVAASATLTLPLADGPIPTPSHVAKAAWRLQHARHHPAALNLPDLQKRKDFLVVAINDAKLNKQDPRPLYRDLSALLDQARIDGAPELSRLQHQFALARQGLAESSLTTDRTWPFMLYSREALTALNDSIRAQFQSAPAPSHSA